MSESPLRPLPDDVPGPAVRPVPARISGPRELLQAVPYLIGFQPHRSLVLVGLADGQLEVTARADLDEPDLPGLVDHTTAALARAGCDELVAAIYLDAVDTSDPAAAADADVIDLDRRRGAGRAGEQAGELAVAAVVHAAADRHGMDVGDMLVTSGGRWRSALCTDPGCCPPRGKLLAGTTPAYVAAATFSGVAPLADRSALEQLLAPRPGREALEPLLAAAEDRAMAAVLEGRAARHTSELRTELFAAAARSADGTGNDDDAADAVEAIEVDDATVAELGVALAEVDARDSMWMAIDSGEIDARWLWRELARRLPSPYDAAPLFLYAWASWRAGNGSLAGIAAQRALTADPDYSAAGLVLSAIGHGIDPRRVPRLREGLDP